MLDFPSVISIENNLLCNSYCDFCIRKFITRQKEIFDPYLAMKIATQIPSYALVILNAWNEPTMTDNFENLLDIFAPVCTIRFYTNGSLLHKRNIMDKIVEHVNAMEGIYISFNGGDKESYEKTMGLNFDRTRSNIDYLFYECPNIPIHIVSNITKENKEHIDKVKSLFPQAKSFQIEYPWDVRGFRGTQKPIEKIQYCTRLNYYASLTVDGTVQACCNMIQNEVIFGNIKEKSIQDIWLGKEAQEFRRKHKYLKRSEIPTCSRCIG